MSKSKALLIANPNTGRYTSRRTISIEENCAALAAFGIKFDLVSTTGPGDAARIAAVAAEEGVEQVIVAGGDGTINEALQGLVGSKTQLAIVPRGTANVLARELGLPLEPHRAAGVISRKITRRVHVGVAIDETNNSQRYFLLMAGIGLDAAVVRQVTPRLKKRLGSGAFWLIGLSQLARWNPIPFTLEVNGETYCSTFVSIGNARSYGGNLGITPRASLDEPEFEICMIQTTSRVQYLSLLSSAMRSSGLQLDEKGVCFVRATQARATGTVPVQVDGEVIGLLPMRFEIAPQMVEIVVP